MKAYTIDENGIYLGRVDRQLDQLESKIQKKDVYLIPAGAVEVAPPTVIEKGKVAQWDGKAWALIEEPKVIEEPPIDEEPTEEEKAEIKAREDATNRIKATDFSQIKTIAALNSIVRDMAIVFSLKGS